MSDLEDNAPDTTPRPRQDVMRLPQRFLYRKTGCTEPDFGVCYPIGKRWHLTAGVGFAMFTSDPWEVLGQVLGDITEFRWIDNDYNWTE